MENAVATLEKPVKTEDKPAVQQKKSSLSLQIGLIYTLLALINILFFSVMIFENQTELLNKNFNYEYRNFVNSLLSELTTLKISAKKDDDYNRLVNILKINNIDDFIIFDSDGVKLHEEPAPTGESEPRVSADIRRKSIELSIESSVFRTPYKLIPNSENFTVDFFMPMESTTGERLFLYTLLYIDQIKKRLMGLYWQIGLAVGWGILFHVIFGIFVYRVIFHRVNLLTTISDKMTSGDLHARADWEFKRSDELDELGSSFNRMADKIEDTIQTITHLNEEIQNELEVGRDVQQLFLPSKKILKDYNVALYYRPMREVSGDIYNFFNLPNDCKGVFFADASGHGVSAALVTSVVMLYLDEIVKRTMHPTRIIGDLNVVLAEKLQSSFFATGIFLVLLPDGRVLFSNAGHNPVLYIRPGREKIVEFDKCGPPMGMFEDAEYSGRAVLTAPGDKILIYSDALVESKNEAGEMFGLDRVKELYAEHSSLPNDEIVDILKKELDDFTVEYTDDVSIILLEMPE